jgi:hypothetical protein
VTNRDGATDAVYYKIESNRVIIEWSNVRRYISSSAATEPATFQAILELNTGSSVGSITINYPDTDVNNISYDDGKSATLGIKNAGTQGLNRLKIAQNGDDTRFIGSGKAVRIDTDVVAPLVQAESFDLDSLAYVATYSEDVAPSIASGDFQLVNVTTSQTVDPSAYTFAYDAASRTATLAFNGVPADARYRVVTLGDGITDAAGMPLDADEDGIPGGSRQFEFNVLAGDLNGDGVINFNDLLPISQNYGLTPATYTQGDATRDGIVNFNDVLLISQRYGVTLLQSNSPGAIELEDDRLEGSTDELIA